jgi:hypothetical protein
MLKTLLCYTDRETKYDMQYNALWPNICLECGNKALSVASTGVGYVYSYCITCLLHSNGSGCV